MDTTTPPLASIGIKEVFHVVGFGADGKIAFRREIKRLALAETFSKLPPCVVGMEACLSATGTSDVAVNAALAFIEAAHPRDEVEAALLIQMACTHSAVMCVFSRFGGDYGTHRTLTAGSNAVARLVKAYALQVETLRRLRNGGSQLVRVEHVHIYDGGQAIVGTVGVEKS